MVGTCSYPVYTPASVYKLVMFNAVLMGDMIVGTLLKNRDHLLTGNRKELFTKM